MYVNFVSCNFMEIIDYFPQFFGGFFGSAFGIVCIQNLNWQWWQVSFFLTSCVPFISFSCLTELLELALLMLYSIKVVGMGIFILFHILEKKLSIFSPSSYYVSYGFVIFSRYYVEVCFFFMHSPEGFHHKSLLYFVKCSLLHLLKYVIFIF